MHPRAALPPAVSHLLLILLVALFQPSALAAQTANQVVPHRYVLLLSSSSAAPPDLRRAGPRLLHHSTRLGYALVSTPAAQSDAAAMRELSALPGVTAVLHDRILMAQHLAVAPALQPEFRLVVKTPPVFDSYYNSPQGWAVRAAGGYGGGVAGGPASGPWDRTTGRGVRIAILDSGIDGTHPDLAPNLALNLSEVDSSSTTGLPSACDDGSPQDQQGHGSWTASLAAAAQGPGTGQLVGVAPDASLLNIKVLERLPANLAGAATLEQQCAAGEAGGLLSWVLQGIDDAVLNQAEVISMSFGVVADLNTGEGSGLKTLFDHVTYAAQQAGAVLVAAAGNNGYNLTSPRYIELPAQARGVLAVAASTNPACAEDLSAGATCQPGPVTLAQYSNFGAPLQAIAAPGGSDPEGPDLGVSGWVRGACSSGEPGTVSGLPGTPGQSYGCFGMGHAAYVQAKGTSASAPLLAGAAALLRALHPEWTPAQVVAALQQSADVLPTLPFPLLNTQAAMDARPVATAQDDSN
ncbi:MAG: S8 family serine peptidase [Acidobacteriota bacterium]|nr:S8 family serine peptidase [Acidobacteriota bacterium]